MRSHSLFLIAVLALLKSGGSPGDSSEPPRAGDHDALGVGECSTGTIDLNEPAPADLLATDLPPGYDARPQKPAQKATQR